ncbi:MAG TPA: hypothetical protein VNI77_01675, partial [Nitrososphaera sp.]|nr:hypothetical protein [Nitrososphaera sp.]
MERTVLKKVDVGRLMLRRIAELERRTGIHLGLAQKILLAETGTVEQVLSILAGSPIKVKVIEQKENARTITRQSLLMNESGKTLVVARSKVFAHNLPARILSQIRRQESGIGTIIANSRLETYRKIVEIGYDPVKEVFFRKYQIICKKKIIFEIVEELVG